MSFSATTELYYLVRFTEARRGIQGGATLEES